MSDKTVMIKYRKNIESGHLDALASEGVKVINVADSVNIVIAIISPDVIEKIKSYPDVEYVEEDQEAHTLELPSDLELMLNSGQQITPWGVQKIRAPEVWQNNKGTGIKWCVIDTGVNRTHPDLSSNIKGGFNYINFTDNFEDDNGHGTHVCGIIAAVDNDIGVVGVAPEVNLYAYKVLDANGSGSYSSIVSAINDAIQNGMQGINMSLGGTAYSQALKDACMSAYNAGIVIVAAAGNSGGDGSQDTVLYPAKFSESVIAVAATDASDVRAIFSSCGPEVEVAAPGVSIPSTVPPSGTKYSNPTGYMNLSGTSMGTPHVSGTVALILKAHPEYKPADVRDALNKTSVDLGSPGKDNFYGYGRVDAAAAVNNNPQPPPEPVLTNITVLPQNATVEVGKSIQYIATALDQNNNPMTSINIVWSVDNSTIGTVFPTSSITGTDGKSMTTFTALTAGNTAISASNGNIIGKVTVIVQQPSSIPVFTKIVVSPPTTSLSVGKQQQFKATALDQNNNPMSGIRIRWDLTKPAIGFINPISSTTGPDGSVSTNFIATSVGNATLIASSGVIQASAIITVTPPPAGKDFKVYPMGVAGHYMGVTVIKFPHAGDHTADEACKDVCDLLKQMSP